MALTLKQEEACKLAVEWWSKNLNQIFVISGYAGCGKSYLVRHIIERLGLDEYSVRYVAFTGKASLVLTQSGNDACTIHRLIYDMKVIMGQDGKLRKVAVRKEYLDSKIKLIVVDEVSMVSKEMLDDIASYGIKMICIGDPGQLPPMGSDNRLLKEPDIFLDQIMRQAQDNPIIYLSMKIRNGYPIQYGTMDGKVAIIPSKSLKQNTLLNADQMICGFNTTRRNINLRMRSVYGYNGDLPVVGDKLICKKNNWSEAVVDDSGNYIALVNGLIGYCTSVPICEEDTIQFNFKPDFCEEQFEDLKATVIPFLNPTAQLNFFSLKDNAFDFGYAITAHASQGSQWDKVLVFNEILKKSEHRRWLYTACTRAIDRLTVVL